MPVLSCLLRFITIIGLAFLWMMPASLAKAQEDILDYQVDIFVNLDRSIDVVETITVDVKGQQIKRGIFRDLVVQYTYDDGTIANLDVSNIEIHRNDQPEPFDTSYVNHYLRMKIGQKDHFLPHGPHTYRIAYRVDDFVDFFEDVDEVFWNAIGTNWQFPISKANVSLTLPEGGNILQSVIYTGRDGSTDQEGTITKQTKTYINYKANRPLAVGEGMTIAVGWEKGFIAPPTERELQVKALIKQSPLYGLILLAFGSFAYFYRAWRKVGQDPKAGAVIPRFHPPKDISPALASYIQGVGSFIGSNQKAFMASLISLSIKGFLLLDKSQSKLSVKRLEKTHSGELETLPVGEKRLMGSLFYDNLYSDEESPKKKKGRNKLVFSDLKYSQMSAVMSAFTSEIEKKTKETYFNRNYDAAIPAIVVLILASIGFIAATIFVNPHNVGAIMACILGVISGAIIYGCRVLWRSNRTAGIVVSLAVLAFAAFLIFLGATEPYGFLGIDGQDLIVLILFTLMTLLIPLGFELMKAPTKEGQRIIDELNGLKLFMTVAIADKAASIDMPDLTPALYEDLLPYAMALGVEKQWTQNFESLVFSQLPPAEYYDPDWYEGDYRQGHFSSADMDSMNAALSSDLGDSLTAPASSGSASSGGGSSGGGGGGGGGGGW
ncbi:MAG: DUF2207 domain-containing protein [Cohaesibacter sp.]|nr:DUF2207 domain-containing protein [Cohaesibacter sp.]